MRTKTLLVFGFLMLGFSQVVAFGDEIDSKLLKMRASLGSEEDYKRIGIDSVLKHRELLRNVEAAKQIVKQKDITKEEQTVLHSALKFHRERRRIWQRLREILAEENVLAGTLAPSWDKLSDTEALERVLHEVKEKLDETRLEVRLIEFRLKD